MIFSVLKWRRPKCFWVGKDSQSCTQKMPQHAEWDLKSSPCLTSFTDSEWKFFQHFSSMSVFYHKKTLSEADFLSVSILYSCIEMPQLHKLPLSQYLGMWLEFPLLLNNFNWILSWHTHFPRCEIKLSLHLSSLQFCFAFTGMTSRLKCPNREI